MLIEKLWTKTSKTQQDTIVSRLKVFYLVEKLGQQNLKYCYIEIAVQKIQSIIVIDLSLLLYQAYHLLIPLMPCLPTYPFSFTSVSLHNVATLCPLA